jgi:F-type H+-transporting ATPase subunit epsilon
MRLIVLSPEQTVFDGEADGLVAPAFDGLVGILPGHAPFLTLLGAGPLRVRRGGEVSQFAVAGGFLQVTRDQVRVVADRVS